MNKHGKMRPNKTLKKVTRWWFVVTVVGQWIFILYLLSYYIFPIIKKGLVAWEGNKLVTGYVANDTIGNFAVATHILISILILGIGPLQLIPKIRNKFPHFHKWTGRVYLITIVITSFAGFYMVWVRGNPQAGVIEHIGTTLGGILIIISSILTYYNIRLKRITAHSRWALRLFIIASGVWYIRLGYGWFFFLDVSHNYIKAFSIFISYANYIIPLILLEYYFYVLDNKKKTQHKTITFLLLILTMFTGLGTLFAIKYVWLPKF